MSSSHKILKRFLTRKMYEAVKAGTKKWLLECICGYKRDLWELGGIRYKAVGEPKRLIKCPKCGKVTWHTIRKKHANEL